jgi:hypothetical protein
MNAMNLTNRLSRFRRPIFILLILFGPSMVYADTGDILSRFQFYGTVQEAYDSNVNLTSNRDKKDDLITTVSLGLRFSTLPRSEATGEFQPPLTTREARYGIFLDFLPSYVYYGGGTNDNYVSLSGNMDAWYTWEKNLTFRIKDYLIRSEEPLEQNYSSTALPGQILLGSQTGRPIYFRNVTQPSLEYRFGEGDIISVNLLNNVYKNRSPLFENSMENSINPKVTYWFNIRHGVVLEYALDLGDFQRSPDTTANLGRGRYIYRFDPTTSVFAEYTFERREFERQVTNPALGYDVHVPAIGFEYAFSPTLSLTGKFGYFWQIVPGQIIEKIMVNKKPTVQILSGSNEAGPVYDIVIKQRSQKTTYTLGFQGGYTEDYFTAQNLGFAKYNQVVGTITHQLMERFAVTVSSRYQRPKFSDGRVDNLWGITTAGSYRILRWLTLGPEFSYTGNHSTGVLPIGHEGEKNNYTDFRGIFRVTAIY